MSPHTFRNLSFVCLIITSVFVLRTPVLAAGCEWTDSHPWEYEENFYDGCESSAAGTLGSVGRCETGIDSCLDALEFCGETCEDLSPGAIAFFSCEPEEPEQESADFICRCEYCTEID